MAIDALLKEHLWAETEQIIEALENTSDRLREISLLLFNAVPHYNWVGFYMVGNQPRELVLGPYVGAATEHTHIPFGRGICGQVAEGKQTMVIQDVNTQDNYLACSLDVQSEIVVPILKGDEFIGELDIDSHDLAPFNADDSRLLEGICQRLAKVL